MSAIASLLWMLAVLTVVGFVAFLVAAFAISVAARYVP